MRRTRPNELLPNRGIQPRRSTISGWAVDRTYREFQVDQRRLLIVEDDPGIGSSLERALVNAGYDCERAVTAAEARAVSTEPDLVLLDLGLPDGDGIDVAHDLLARWPALPVLMLTARSEEIDVVIGLDAGAMDYMVKPFRLAELLARIRAQLRGPNRHRDLETLADGDVQVELGSRRVEVAGNEVQLRVKEFDLLVELLSHKGRVVTREDLMCRVWDEHWFGSTKTLDVHVAALRRRLGEDVGAPSRITALRGVGYRWEQRD